MIMKKINIAELLKDCPKGMELDCTIFEDTSFAEITENSSFPIRVKINGENIKGGAWTKEITLTSEGKLGNHPNAKCVIFPKGKTTWEGFQRPFRDGDIVATKTGMFIGIIKIENGMQQYAYVAINGVNNLSINIPYVFERLATEEEKQKLFQAIKEYGYKWNAETKTLEKLPKFKVGNRIRHKENKTSPFTITEITDTSYKGGYRYEVLIEQQDNFELVPNKFDITTLKPFESRVLVRDTEAERWKPAIWGYYDVDHIGGYPYETVGCICFCFCIPYEGNQHLLSTTNDCDDFYKTWK